MPLATQSFDAGPEGAAVTTANSGLSLLVLGATSTALYRAAAAVRGPFGARFTGADTEQAYGQVALTSSPNQVCLVAFKVNAATLPPTGSVGTIARYRNASAQALITVLSSNGKVQVQNRSGVTVSGMILNNNTALPDGEYWLQLEVQVNTTTGTASSCQARLFDATTGNAVGVSASSTAVDTGTAALTIFQAGKTASAGLVVVDVDEWHTDSATTTPIALPAVTTNAPPLADAGVDQTVEPWATVTLTGAASTDTDGTVASYTWRQISGPAVTLAGTGATRTFTAPGVSVSTPLVFGLIVTDNAGAASTEDTVTVTALPATEFYLSAGGVWEPLRVHQL